MPEPTAQDRIARFEALVAQFPDNVLPVFSLAQAYLDAEDWVMAERLFGRVEALKPDYMMAVVHRATCQLQLGDLDAARATAERGRVIAVAQGHTGPRDDCEALIERIDAERDGGGI